MSILIEKRSRVVSIRGGFPFVNVAGQERRVSVLLGDGDSNTKTAKNDSTQYASAGLSLSPSDTSGAVNTCPNASHGCKETCLDETGYASIHGMIRAQRVAKTTVWKHDRGWFLDQLHADISKRAEKARKSEKRLAVRLNMFSDIYWERHGVIDAHPGVMFYDYSKSPKRYGFVRPNYWVTFSRSEENESDCLRILNSGGNVAVVFYEDGDFAGNASGRQVLPETWQDFPVVDGDTTDLRFEDPRSGYVIGLRLKASTTAKRQLAIASGFAVPSLGHN